jgi:hypothetical protein
MGLSSTSQQIDHHVKTNLPQFMKSLKLKVNDYMDLKFLSELSIPAVLPIPKELIEYKFPKSPFLVLDPQFRAASDEFKRQLNNLHKAASKIPILHSEISTVQYEMDSLDIQHERLKDTEKNVQEECLLESTEMAVLSELMTKEQEEKIHHEELLKKKLETAREIRQRQEEQRQFELAQVLKAKRGIFKHRFLETLTRVKKQ